MFEYPKSIKTVHRFEFMGDRFAFDVNSVSAFKIDRPTWDILELMGAEDGCDVVEELKHRYPKPQIDEILRDLKGLQEAGELFSTTPPANSRWNAPWHSLVLQIAHDCDLRCKYCFAGYGRYQGSSALMNIEVAERAVDFFIRESRGAKDLTLSLFGGEPLLNMKLIEHIVPYARSEGEKHGKIFKNIIIVSNGVLLKDRVVRYLDDNGILLKVSLDGPAEIHDRTRPMPSGRGSHDVILKALERVKGTGLANRTTLRATYCSASLEISRIFSYLLDAGFKSVEIEPANLPADNEFAIRREHLPVLRKEYGKIANLYLDKLRDGEQLVFGSFESILRRLANGRPKLNECRAAEGSLTVSPDGSIYPCFELDGCDEHRVGDVFQGVKTGTRDVWLDTCYVDSKIHCRDCWARYLCGGGCRAHSIKFNADMLLPVEIECELRKIQFEASIWLVSKLQEEFRDASNVGFLSKRATT